MAFGTLKADTLTHSTAGSLDTNFVVEGSVKQWGRINQDTPAILDSFNSSSLTDVGTGTHRFVFTNNMNNANYACSGMAQAEAVARGTQYTNSSNNSTSLVERFDIEDGSARDASNSATITCGDLA
jgi:hypothetical protein